MFLTIDDLPSAEDKTFSHMTRALAWVDNVNDISNKAIKAHALEKLINPYVKEMSDHSSSRVTADNNNINSKLKW